MCMYLKYFLLSFVTLVCYCLGQNTRAAFNFPWMVVDICECMTMCVCTCFNDSCAIKSLA